MTNTLVPAIRQTPQSIGNSFPLSKIYELDESFFNVAPSKPAQLPTQTYRFQSTALTRQEGLLLMKNLDPSVSYQEMIAACGPLKQALMHVNSF